MVVPWYVVNRAWRRDVFGVWSEIADLSLGGYIST